MKQAFTLIELAIVLIILGLLAGGVLYGQNLIKAAELRAVASESEKFQAALMTFRGKYFYYPGDMPNATDFWGAINATDTTCITLDSPDGQLTCNGNGNGEIDNYATEYSERFHAWVHMTNAGLIAGNYTGHTAGAAGSTASVPGENVPASKMGGAGWNFAYTPDYPTGNDDHFPGNYGNLLLLTSSTTGVPSDSWILTPEEMWNIDSKIDDGRPASGRIYSNRGGGAPATWAPDCADSADGSVAEYNITNTDVLCRFNLKLGK